jgi:hypothetical protein
MIQDRGIKKEKEKNKVKSTLLALLILQAKTTIFVFLFGHRKTFLPIKTQLLK